MAPPFIDITGQRFGKLTVRCKTNKKNADGKYLWQCDCDCGNIVYRTYYHLKKSSRSCGQCKNMYKEKDGYMIGYQNDKNYFYFDIDDFDKIKQYTWYFDHQGYVVTSRKINGKKRYIQMHRLILDAPENMVVDHINHITYDNRKSNLRICTKSQNCLNKKVQGCTLRKNGKYDVALSINGINTFVGSFNTKEEAWAARTAAYDNDHKEFCFENNMNKGE